MSITHKGKPALNQVCEWLDRSLLFADIFEGKGSSLHLITRKKERIDCWVRQASGGALNQVCPSDYRVVIALGPNAFSILPPHEIMAEAASRTTGQHCAFSLECINFSFSHPFVQRHVVQEWHLAGREVIKAYREGQESHWRHIAEDWLSFRTEMLRQFYRKHKVGG